MRGQQALNRARDILWSTLAASVFDATMVYDDIEFVEHCILETLEENDSVNVIGRDYYTTRKKVAELCR